MTNVVAWLALAVSSVSLAWQVTSWIISGPRVIVRSAEEFVWSEHDQESMPRRLVVVATNIGRQATTVHEIGIRIPRREIDGRRTGPATLTQGPEGERLPARLEVGDEFTARFEGPAIEDFIGAGWQFAEFVPMVRAANKWVFGKFSAEEKRVAWPSEPPSESVT